jgi:hypothetical protein
MGGVNDQRRPLKRLSAPVAKQLETIWTRTLNDFTEDNNPFTLESEHAASGETPLRLVEITHQGNDHLHHEV